MLRSLARGARPPEFPGDRAGKRRAKYEDFFQRLQWRFPGKAWFYRGFNEPLAHWIKPGPTSLLMPSRYEPCGLNQIYSLR